MWHENMTTSASRMKPTRYQRNDRRDESHTKYGKKNQSVVILLTVLINTSFISALPAPGNPVLPNDVRVIPLLQVQPQQFPEQLPQPRDVYTNKINADLCPLCIQFTEQAINQLLNIILNGGVVEGCSTVCNALAQKTGSQILGAACNILCDIVGVQEFAKLVEKADLDPIYLCEELKACPVFDGGDAVITSIVATPRTGPKGERDITFDFMSKNGTGTGEVVINIDTVDKIPIVNGFLQEPQQPGNYTKSLKLKAEPDPNCDPSQGPCERWLPGNYTITIAICNGECGSKHPHSKVYDSKQSVFVITP